MKHELVVALEVEGDPLDILLAVYVNRVGARLVGGSPTFSPNPSLMAAAVFDPFSVRVVHWLSCLRNPFDVILSDPALAPARLTVPFVTVGVDAGLVVPQAHSVRRWLADTQVLVMVGDPPRELTEQMAASGRWRGVAVISTQPDLVDAALAANGGQPRSNPGEPAVRWSSAPTTVIGAVVDASAPSHTVMELALEYASAIAHMGNAKAAGQATLLSRARRPALPYPPDLELTMVSLAGNMARGRLPEDDGALVADYAMFARDDLWLVPWSAALDLDRSQLLVELNRRLASEWIATRACFELYGTGNWTAADADAAATEKATATLRAAFRRWLPRGTPAEERTEEMREERLGAIASGGISPARALRLLARSAYDACSASGEYADLDVAAQGLSFANPCVIVLTSGQQELLDFDLIANTSAWATVAARTSGALPGVIVPSLLAPGELQELNELQSSIRKAVLEYEDAPSTHKAVATAVATARGRLGEAIRDRLDPATETLLGSLNPSRLIAFSDIVMDALPRGKSILGLEMPCCRFPARGNANQYVAQVVAASRRSLDRAWRRRAAIVIAPEAGDEVTAWGLTVATLLEDALALVGWTCVRPVQQGMSVESMLAAAGECSMIFFVGHGQASDAAAGLNLGTETLTIERLTEQDWSDKLVCLIGCETAAVDAADMASVFLGAGARAVIGSLTRIRVDVARTFFDALLRWSTTVGAPLDYAFFCARCEAALYEILVESGLPTGPQTAVQARQMFAVNTSFAKSLGALNLEWSQVHEHVLFSMGLTLLGGAGETLV